MAAIRLPVSRAAIVLRSPAGADDVALIEARPLGLPSALAFLARLARGIDGEAIDLESLPVGDIDVLLLRLRQHLIGDVVNGEDVCPACQAPVDITFTISAYLAHHVPEAWPGVEPAGDEGWYRLADGTAEFRVPCAGDQLAIATAIEPEQALRQRCVRPNDISASVRREVEAAMEAIAPTLYTQLEGQCPGCGAAVSTTFDPLLYTLRELRDRAMFVYEEVCAIAHHFHWSETEILTLPAVRRGRYAELAVRYARQNRTTA